MLKLIAKFIIFLLKLGQIVKYVDTHEKLVQEKDLSDILTLLVELLSFLFICGCVSRILVFSEFSKLRAWKVC